jgi:glutamyl-tRNA synthetase/glutamyl-Q tRNA(Asp) synthetase
MNGAADALEPGFTTRFAPAPTGYLHLGHVASALWVWGLARLRSGRVLLRIEDHDRTRWRPEYERTLLDDLEWLGFTPDAPPVRQSERTPLYVSALARLEAEGLVYVCDCTRAKVREISPAKSGEESRYPGTCRVRALRADASPQRRVRLDPLDVSFVDARLGPRTQRPSEQCGDVLVRDRSSQWTYQFAVVVDDLDQGIDLVIRGEDILSSTGRQIQLARLLGRAAPRYLHHPLVLDPQGRKLSKSRRDTGVRELRAAGASPASVRGRAAAAVGLLERGRDLELDAVPGLLAS